MSVVLSERQGAVGIVTLNRPEALNAWGADISSELIAVFAEFEADRQIRAIILTGAGRAFSAGANLKNPRTHAVESVGDHLWTIDPRGSAHFNAVADCAKPIIAAVNGWALGIGFQITLCCDYILAAEAARFGLPQVGIGVLPAYGGALRLARIVGKNKAMEMAISSRPIDAAEAYRIGLVGKVYPQDELMPAALAQAEHIASLPPLAVRLAKESLNKGMDTGSMKEAAQADIYRFMALMQTEDRHEGHQAWRERRQPVFAGR
jgi:enoyl-CoA hydratase/carnithine racemase